MRTNLLVAALAALLSVPALAQNVEVKISFPWAAPPPLVVVEPGIQVVPDYDGELFFVDGWYWTRRDGRWLHGRDLRSPFIVVPAPPATLARIPAGKYRRWKAEKAIIKHEVKAERAVMKHERLKERGDQGEHGEREGGGHGRGHKK